MKKLLGLLLLLPLLFASACTDLDDVNHRLDDHEQRLLTLEELVKQANENIKVLQELIKAQEQNLKVVACVPTKDGSAYILTFSDGTAIVVKNAVDGKSPEIGVKTDDDGKLYWTINGDFMRNANGEKIAADGAQGVKPILRVNTDGCWEMSADGGKTWMIVTDAQGSPVKAVGVEKPVDLTITEDEYSVIITYNGHTFVLPKAGKGDLGMEFLQGEGSYYGNWYNPHCDDATVTLYAGEFDASGKWKKGQKLTMSIFMPKLADYNTPAPRLAEGVYRVTPDRGQSYLFVPMLIKEGSSSEVWGMFYNSGFYIEDNTSGETEVRTIKSGKVIVTHIGDKDRIIFDCVDGEGLEFKAYFYGNLNLANKNDNDKSKPARPYSTNKKSVALNIPASATTVALFMDDYLYEQYNSWGFQLNLDAKTGDYVTFEILADKSFKNKIPTGTFNLTFDASPATAFPAALNYSRDMLYSWYGNCDTRTADGAFTELGALTEGTITISEVDGIYTFTFNCKDDAGNAYTGKWTGDVKLYSSDDAPRKLTARRKARR